MASIGALPKKPPTTQTYIYTQTRVSLPITTFQQSRSRSRMKQSKDPFEAAFEESPPDSPIEIEPEPVNPNSNSLISQPSHIHEQQQVHVKNTISNNTKNNNSNKDDEEDEEEDEDNMDVELAKFRAVGDPHKMAKMQLVTNFFHSFLKCYVIFHIIYDKPYLFFFVNT